MWFFLALLVPVAVLLLVAGVTDLRARRRGRRSRVDGRAVRDGRRANDADLQMRSHHQHIGHGEGGF